MRPSRSFRLVLPVLAVLAAAIPAHARHPDSMWGPLSDMYTERFKPAAVRLADGRALVVGGTTRYEYEPGRFRWEPQRSAEIYEPSTATWTRVADAPIAFGESADAVLLSDGTVFIYEFGRDPYVYDPAGDTWRSVGPTLSITSPAVTKLTDGRILLIGGDALGKAVAEIYDHATGSFTAVSPPPTRRSGVAVTLGTGEVLYVGCTDQPGGTASADLYNPTFGSWQTTVMMQRRCRPSVTRLTNGSVLVAGGADSTIAMTAEVYDPGRRRWSAVASMRWARSDHTALALPDGSALVVGGKNSPTSAERFFPQTGTWLEVDGLDRYRRDPSSVLLDGGRALIVGGQDYITPGDTSVIFESLESRLGTLIVEQFVTKRRHTARFIDAGTGAGVAGATLRFSANGIEICDATTAADGWASCPTDVWTAAGVAALATQYDVAAVDVAGYRDVRCTSGYEDPYDPEEEQGRLDPFTQQGRCTARAVYD